jgi:hypothetical protein
MKRMAWFCNYRAFMVFAAALLAFLPAAPRYVMASALPAATSQAETVTFADLNLEAAVREALGKPTGEITTEDMASLTILDASNRGIQDLTGLEHAVNLDRLNLWQNQLTDISPLAGLTSLTKLKLYRNQLTDISPLAGLTNLWGLYLEENQIANISPLAGLTNLKEMDLGDNRIADLSPLAGLTNLEHLEISENLISGISPFAGLTRLNWLELWDNQVADISPLVANEGIGEGDYIDLRTNPLNEQAHTVHIPELQDRGVEVLFSPPVSGGCAPVTIGGITSGSLGALGEEDCYSFSGVPGEVFLTRAVKTSGEIELEMRMYRPDGTTLLCSKKGTSIVEQLCTLKNTGTHTLWLGDVDDDETGGYNLYFQRTNNPANATPLSFGETISGSVSAIAEMDAFTFSGAAGDRVVTNMARTSGSFQPEARVYGPDGKLICSKTGSLLSHQLCTLKLSGVHTVLAGDNGGNETGDYNLYFQRANGPVNASPLDFSETVSGDIGMAAEMDAFTFSGAAGDRVLARMVKTSGSIQPYLRIYRPDGTARCSKSGGTIADTLCTLDKDGVHTVLASDSSGPQTGSYTLYIQRTNNPANATPLSFGETVSGEIGMTSEMDAFTFEGTANQSVVVQMARTSGAMQTELRIYRPDGSLICSKKGTPPIRLTCTPATDGTYTILAGDVNGDETGSYTLSLQ